MITKNASQLACYTGKEKEGVILHVPRSEVLLLLPSPQGKKGEKQRATTTKQKQIKQNKHKKQAQNAPFRITSPAAAGVPGNHQLRGSCGHGSEDLGPPNPTRRSRVCRWARWRQNPGACLKPWVFDVLLFSFIYCLIGF